MAEFCLDRWNELNDRKDTERDVVLSDEVDLCEGCGEYRRVVVTMRRCKWMYDIKAWWRKDGRL